MYPSGKWSPRSLRRQLGAGLLFLSEDAAVRLCQICRSALVLHERALAGGVGVPSHDFERPVEDLLGAYAAIDKALDTADPVFDDLAFSLKYTLVHGSPPGKIVSTPSAATLRSAAPLVGSHSCSQPLRVVNTLSPVKR
jgi:hypothetical protein